ncbi:MAG: nucleoside 2-deoxyribosyltransferase [Bacteroidales bacterium]|jgi:nucleoside 2-deoxyribosyltransferase|nr:nucleoside 2-deoxyribosyltransferase [Bacteroidales bacterium]
MGKIYFAGSIRGGRNDRVLYREIIGYLQQYGEVLTGHIGNEDLSPSGETNMLDQEIYDRDMAWLTSADSVVAEVTVPSLGVGFEIATAIGLQKKILCLYRSGDERRLSAMIAGCPSVFVKEYSTFEEAQRLIDAFFIDRRRRHIAV